MNDKTETINSQDQFSRDCPNCENKIHYKSQKAVETGQRKMTKCRKCINKIQNDKNKGHFERNCPSCGKKIEYIYKRSFDTAVTNNTECKSCYITKACAKPERRKQMSERVKGDKNPMYGKPSTFKGHTPEMLRHIVEVRDTSVYKTEEFRKKQRDNNSGINNPMYGRTVYSVWIEKYGKEIADQKMIEYKKKQSIANSGEKNSNFGKPPSRGAGNGWKGWYKEIFFRSLRELSFLIWLDEEKLEWSTGESRKIKIEYTDWSGQIRNYFPDFIVGNIMYEVKPKRLWESPTVKLKKEAAEKYCLERNMEYKLIDPGINSELIIDNFKNGNIKWSGKYEIKFLEFIEKSNKN